jgi:RND family efflux transporter MFP subunit
MDMLLHAVLSNAVWAAALALVAAAGARVWRGRPAVGHALWLIVLLKLVTPSVIRFELPPAMAPARELATPGTPGQPLGTVSAVPPSPDDFAILSARAADPGEDKSAGASRERSTMMLPQPTLPLAAWSSALSEFSLEMVLPAALLFWLVGAVVWWWAACLSSFRFRRLIGSARPAPVDLLAQIDRIAARLGLSRIPAAYIIDARVSPMVWVPLAGPPRLVLPEELWGRLATEQQNAILAHELAHLKRRDHWVRRLETLACGLYWWDPIAWWARREVEQAEERCCDAWVLWALPAAAAAYAEALVTTAVYLSGHRRPLPSGASGAERLRPLKRRLHMILSDSMSVSVARKAPRRLLILAALSLPLLPVAGFGVASDDALPAEIHSQDQPGQGAKTAAKTDEKPDPVKTESDQPKQAKAAESAIPTVRVSHPAVRELSDFEIFPGRVAAGRQVELKARVSGILTKVHCSPGQVVTKGELLFQIDARPYRAELDKAQAELDGAQARWVRRRKDLDRATRLLVQKSISQEEVNLIESESLEAEASVKVALAARDLARLKLESTDVTAPFAGAVSGTVLAEGNLVVADTTRLSTVITTNPVHVGIDVSQQIFTRINRLKHDGKIKGGSWIGLPVTVVLPEELDMPLQGKIDSAEPRIEPSTGTSRWRAAIPNPEGLLLPGMFVSVRLTISEPRNRLVVPPEAIVHNAVSTNTNQRKFVFVLTDQNVVKLRPVTTGHLDDGVLPVEGLKPEDWVVIGHNKRLTDGDRVLPERVPPAKSTR